MTARLIRAFGRGALASAPLWLAIIPFGAIFGALAIRAGLDLGETMAMTAIVAAGASQLAALQLMGEGAPAVAAVLAGAVVNLRMAMYSASLAQQWQGAGLGTRIAAAFFLHDHAYALTTRRAAERPEEPLPDRLGFFFGVGLVTILVWMGACYAGALAGAGLPEAWGLHFAGPLIFIAVAAPFLRTLPHVAAAAVASGLALALADLPYGAGLILAAAAGVATGAGLETARGRR